MVRKHWNQTLPLDMNFLNDTGCYCYYYYYFYCLFDANVTFFTCHLLHSFYMGLFIYDPAQLFNYYYL